MTSAAATLLRNAESEIEAVKAAPSQDDAQLASATLAEVLAVLETIDDVAASVATSCVTAGKATLDGIDWSQE